jgi:hypothetical protein
MTILSAARYYSVKAMRKALLTLFVAAGALWAQSTPFFFLQFSDPQFGMYEKNAGFSQEQANLDFALPPPIV